MSLIRWGFVSTASIGHKNWQAIQLSGNGVLSAVASRSLDSANAFIDQCNSWCPWTTRPNAFASYQDLIDSDDVDAIYIPLPTGMRKDLVIAAAKSGKHVMCEKPCAASASDLQEMIDACKSNNVQFMDGVMFMHTKRLDAIRNTLDDGASVGEIKRVTCQFSFCADDEWLSSNIRLDSKLEPQGCLGDLGWYCIRFILWSLKYEMPVKVEANILTDVHRASSEGPVPIEFSAELFFENGKTGQFYCSFITHHQQWANVSGNKGYVHVSDFVLPYTGDSSSFEVSQADFVTNGCDFEMRDNRKSISCPEAANSGEDSQETNLFRTFNQLALSEKPDYSWAEISLKTQQVLDSCLMNARNR